MNHYKVPNHELDLSFVRSSGPGGQNVNKVNSKCILKWKIDSSDGLPFSVKQRFIEKFANKISSDGFVVISSDRFRDQKRNYEDCVEKLNEMIRLVANPPKLRKKTKATRSSQKKRMDEKKVHSDKKRMRRSSWD